MKGWLVKYITGDEETIEAERMWPGALIRFEDSYGRLVKYVPSTSILSIEEV